MNLQAIRDMVRTQLDLDDTDLPDTLLDQYVRDAYQRVIGLENRWPSFESLWAVPAVANTAWVDQPATALEVESVMSADGWMLTKVDRRWAAQMFNLVTPESGNPQYWYRLGTQLYVLPVPTTNQTLTLYGWRHPVDWVSAGASAEVDADVRLHLPLVWYCCSTGYAQQEDEVLEQTYMNRFKEASALARDSVMRAWSGQPKQFASLRYNKPTMGMRPTQLLFTPPGPVVEKDTIIGGTP